MKYLSALLVIATLAACSSPTGPDAGLKSGSNTTAESRYILISGVKQGPTTADSRYILISGVKQAPQAPAGR